MATKLSAGCHPAPGLVIAEGTIYPLLSRLKQEGLVASRLVESPSGPARRNYVLTEAGRRHLRNINEEWRDIAKTLSDFIVPDEPPRENKQ